MALHSDPTANQAIGAVGREWKQMVRRAIAIRKMNREPSPEEQRMFTGIYRQLLLAPIDVLIRLGEKGK